jgi:hypothetical protein
LSLTEVAYTAEILEMLIAIQKIDIYKQKQNNERKNERRNKKFTKQQTLWRRVFFARS